MQTMASYNPLTTNEKENTYIHQHFDKVPLNN